MEVIRARIVLVAQCSIAIKVVTENIVVVDDQVENVVGISLANGAATSSLWPPLLGKTLTQPSNAGPTKNLSSVVFRDLKQNTPNCVRVFGSDKD